MSTLGYIIARRGGWKLSLFPEPVNPFSYIIARRGGWKAHHRQQSNVGMRYIIARRGGWKFWQEYLWATYAVLHHRASRWLEGAMARSCSAEKPRYIIARRGG